MQKQNGLVRFSWTALLACLVLLAVNFAAQVFSNTSYREMYTDSGIFAACAQNMLEGGLLYRDCFDNKPPGIFLLNAVVLAAAGPNPSAIWLFQAVWFGLTGVAAFLLLRAVWGGPAGFLAALLFLAAALHPEVYHNGNYTETYVALIQFAVFAALWRFLAAGRLRWLAAVGLLGALAFLLKPTYAAGAVLAGLVGLAALLGGRLAWRRLLSGGLAWLAGFAAPLALVAAYWAVRGALYDLVFAVFLEPRAYVAGGFSFLGLLRTLADFVRRPNLALLTLLALLSALAFLARDLPPLVRRRADGSPPFTKTAAQRWWLLAVVLTIPAELLLIGLSGRSFPHYFLQPLPALAAASAYGLSLLAATWRGRRLAWAGPVALGLAGFFFLLRAVHPAPAALADFRVHFNLTRYQPNELQAYLREHSRPDQSVLVWATHPSLNLLSGRRSPTRYIFPLHIFKPVPSGATGFPELLEELEADPPALIVAQVVSSAGLPDFWSPDEALCPGCSPAARAGLQELKRYMERHYVLDTQIWDFVIYRRVDGSASPSN